MWLYLLSVHFLKMLNKDVSFKCWDFSPKLRKLTHMYVTQERPFYFSSVIEEAIRKETEEIAPRFYYDLENKMIDPSIQMLPNLESIFAYIDELINENKKERDMFDPYSLLMAQCANGEISQETKDKITKAEKISKNKENQKKARQCNVNAIFLYHFKNIAFETAKLELLRAVSLE